MTAATFEKNDRKIIWGWAMYDWANSAYITTFAAIVSAFFTGVIVGDEGWNGFSGQTLWSAVISIGAFVLFLMMPVLGAIADYASAKKRFLRRAATFWSSVNWMFALPVATGPATTMASPAPGSTTTPAGFETTGRV